MVIMIDSGT